MAQRVTSLNLLQKSLAISWHSILHKHIRQASEKKLEFKLLTAIKKIDDRPIRGEFKIWILKNYLAPSILFLLTVDLISESSLMKLQSKLTKFIKKWLNLPRCLTQAAIYHPDVLQLPFLPQIREQAKLSMVMALEFTSDPYVKEFYVF